MMRYVAGILVFALLVGVGRGDEGAVRVTVEGVAGSYRGLRLMTKEPVDVDPGLALVCAGLTPGNVEAARKRSGPHALCQLKIYMDALAAGVFGKEGVKYPVGAVIVKEKHLWYREGKASGASQGALGGGTASTQPAEGDGFVDGVGGMLKREAGYDPGHGDWEYFYFEDPKKIEHGKMRSCIECHAGVAERDYVFGSWAGRK